MRLIEMKTTPEMRKNENKKQQRILQQHPTILSFRPFSLFPSRNVGAQLLTASRISQTMPRQVALGPSTAAAGLLCFWLRLRRRVASSVRK